MIQIIFSRWKNIILFRKMNNVNTTFKNRLAIYILSVANRHYFSINVMYPKLGCAIFNLFTKHFFWNNDSPKPPNYFKKLAQINSYPLNKSGETISKITKARGRPQFEIHIYIVQMLATPLCKRSVKQRSHLNVKMFALSPLVQWRIDGILEQET